jgi:sigma-B regulation protein RsbU (phosphoserine phosphatase)
MLSGDAFDRQDREFVKAVAVQLSAGIERRRLRQFEVDINRAARIQRALLPTVLPNPGGITIDASCCPLRVVGGDYYDAFSLADEVVAICIGDVVGKGMPAALLMAKLQGAVRALASVTTTPSKLCEMTHRQIAQSTGPGEFVTFVYAIVDVRTGRLQYTNAGHNAPLLLKADGSISRLDEGGPPLGLKIPPIDRTYVENDLLLESGDCLLLFTDGVTEATDSDGTEFGEDRLVELLRSAAGMDAAHVRHTVMESVTRFSRGVFHDDVTILVLTV